MRQPVFTSDMIETGLKTYQDMINMNLKELKEVGYEVETEEDKLKLL